MKTLYTATDIENLARNGQRTLTLGPDALLTPLAQDRALELGVELRWSQEKTPAAPSQAPASPRPPATPSGLAADALAAFVGLLQQVRDETADVPHLARCFGDLLRAVEQGDILPPPARPEPVRLPEDRRQALAARIEKLDALGRYLFGPVSASRRFDVLWTLDALKAALKN